MKLNTDKEVIMIETQIIKKNNKPIAVILDYNEYLKYKEIQQDWLDYNSALKIKVKTKKWHKHEDVKKDLALQNL
jgi:hypothetical protein